ncbi:cysteine desulfurase IscS [Insulibacter thermoxylanivorax]|uniref:Cysteine desulfurase IscS n=1 Tax=Insulibacter thermoxylanivorax TaxID=2749268 RepID=A0A916QF12_9BACL|nr:cysteine desulfurase family protein [Insulibacter thermoxylanivorax]GFR37182.1 cysteine desulfurase IscS [Insulibacter thermoxylanivorax]
MIYLDNSATTKIAPEVLDAMMPYLKEEYGNPSSKYYSLAEKAKKAVMEAREKIATLLGCDHDEIVFTSGATESNNMIIKGVSEYYGDHKRTIITTTVEHSSVLETCRYLESKGCPIVYLDVDQYGRVSPDQVERAIQETNPVLVSIIWGNNEIGSLNPIAQISKICKEYNVMFHSDATQVVGKVSFDMKEFPGLRFLSLSAHKMYGPKGIGAAVIRKESENIYTKITPLLHGGGQENDYRSGTLAVHNIVGFGKAAELIHNRASSDQQKLAELEQYLVDILSSNFGDKIVFNNDHTNKIPGILSVQFKGVNNELLLKKLSPYVALSTGSACSSSKPSHVLSAIGKSLDEIRQTVRFSLSPHIEKKDLDFFKNLK